MENKVNSSREKSIYRVTWVGFAVNVLLTAGKFVAGFVGHSGAMIADAIHSLSDFATDLIVLIFVKISVKPKDESHDYGHGKYETLATVLVGVILFIIGLGVLLNSFKIIVRFVHGEIIERPGAIALVAALISVLLKEILYWYTLATARKVESSVLKANAWHHRSDAFSSVGTLVGIGGAYFWSEKWRILDPLAAIGVGLLILKVSYDLVLPGINELMERSLPEDMEREIYDMILLEPSLNDPHNMKTRRIGSTIAIEFHVRVDGSMTVSESHDATERLEQRLREKYGHHTQIIIHIEPHKK